MNLKRGIALLLSILLISLFSPAALAANDDDELAIDTSNVISQEPILDSESPFIDEEKVEVSDTLPTFKAELTDDGIYGTLSYIPDGTEDISVLYSIGGLTYANYGGNWSLTDLAEGMVPLRQLCLAANTHPVEAFKRKAINRLFIKLQFFVDGKYIQTEPEVFSNALNIPIPETPPPFTANISYSEYSGYSVNGKFMDIPANVVRISPVYSLDGQTYQSVQDSYPNDWILDTLGTDDELEKSYLENHVCFLKNNEPLKSYLANKLNQFYVRLQITTDDGDIYNTQAALIERETLQTSPAELSVFAAFPSTMFDHSQTSQDGQYQITVRENITPNDLRSLLPDTLPVKVSFLQKDTGEFFTSGIVNCKAEWKEFPDFRLTAGESLIIPDAANLLTISAGTEVTTPHGRYILENSLAVGSTLANGNVQLMLSAVGMDEKPDISLSTKTIQYWETLSLAFRQKPSGATSIKAYAFTEEDGERTEIGELLSHRDLNHNQWAQLYGYVPLLRPDESPFKEYLDEKIHSLSIVIEIDGGTFDGEQITLMWPGEYDPPSAIPEDDSEGNKGDVGSDGSENDDSPDNGGQRPNLPSIEENPSDSDSSSSEPLRPKNPQFKPPPPKTDVVTAPEPPPKTDVVTAPEPPPETKAITAPEPPSETKAITTPEPPPETKIIVKKIAPPDSSSAPTASDDSDTVNTPLAPTPPETPVPTTSPNEKKTFVQSESTPKRKTDGVVPITSVILLLGGSAVAVGASMSGGVGLLSRLKKMLKVILRFIWQCAQ